MEWVDGDGVISDDSSFYGDEDVMRTLEPENRRSRKRVVRSGPQKTSKTTKHASTKPTQADDRDRPEPSTMNALDFLKSRPQLAALRATHGHGEKPDKIEPSRTANGTQSTDLVDVDRSRNPADTWQLSETVDNFLRRLPVADAATANAGPWLWVHAPKLPWSHHNLMKSSSVASFTERGSHTLVKYAAKRTELESQNPSSAQTTITRKMRPYKESLENDLLSAAVETHVVCGKWMLFPKADDLPRYWRQVAKATAEGKLGPTAKVGTWNGLQDYTLICVYTYDFTDGEDVRRVLNELVELDLCATQGKPIYYKCDAYTYLGIESKNDYGLRASLFSSKDILHDYAKVMKDGAIARLKGRSKAKDDFYDFLSEDIP